MFRLESPSWAILRGFCGVHKVLSGGPRLTVLIVCYNHEAYIRRACESVLQQKLNEPFKVVIADDDSTDSTRQVIAEIFASAGAMAPSVQFLDMTRNLGITKNYQRAFAACETEYVAVLEGDDYWIHPEKLALQLAFLDLHRECAAVSANYFVYDEKACRITARSQIDEKYSYLDSRMLILENIIGNFSTCMYRLEALRGLPERLFHGTVYDWGVNLAIGRSALIGFLHTPLSVYRVHEQGTWSGMTSNQQIDAQLRVIDHYNISFDYVFDDEFHALKRALQMSPALLAWDRRLWGPRLGAILVACIPPVISISMKWCFRRLIPLFVPPLLPIGIRKFRNYWKARS
jgi:glycosyltransferase involved in cell wall biosynthesis